MNNRYTQVVNRLLSCNTFYTDTIRNVINYLNSIQKIKELTEEFEKLSKEIQEISTEPDFSDDVYLQKLYERSLSGNEADETAYRDEMFYKTEKFFEKIEDTADYRDNDEKLQSMCNRCYVELHDEIDEVCKESEMHLYYAQKHFVENIKQIAEGIY
jgi:hypothetical protein